MKWTSERPATRKTGPNNARRIVWALGKSFFDMFMFFNTNKCFIVYRICKLQNRQPGGRLRGKRAHTTLDASFGP